MLMVQVQFIFKQEAKLISRTLVRGRCGARLGDPLPAAFHPSDDCQVTRGALAAGLQQDHCGIQDSTSISFFENEADIKNSV